MKFKYHIQLTYTTEEEMEDIISSWPIAEDNNLVEAAELIAAGRIPLSNLPELIRQEIEKMEDTESQTEKAWEILKDQIEEISKDIGLTDIDAMNVFRMGLMAYKEARLVGAKFPHDPHEVIDEMREEYELKKLCRRKWNWNVSPREAARELKIFINNTNISEEQAFKIIRDFFDSGDSAEEVIKKYRELK